MLMYNMVEMIGQYLEDTNSFLKNKAIAEIITYSNDREGTVHEIRFAGGEFEYVQTKVSDQQIQLWLFSKIMEGR